MLRLTLKSGRDGRLLARVMDRGGRPFVLDYGDERVIADIVQRITHGFTVIRDDRLVRVHPEDEDILDQLAFFYLAEGVLVFLEEPNWPGRGSPSVVPLPPPPPQDLQDVPEEDEPTEMVAFDDLPTVDDALTTIYPDEELEDAPTEMLPRPSAAALAEVPEIDDDSDETLMSGLLPAVPDPGRWD